MRGWALTIAIAVGLAGAAGGEAAAQGRWKQPNDLFSIAVPAGWAINEPEENRWTLRPMDDRQVSAGDAPAGCILELTESVETLFQTQGDLDRMIESREFAQAWRGLLADVIDDRNPQHAVRSIHGLRFLQVVADGRVRDPRRRAAGPRAAVLMALALAPGQFWRMTCVLLPESRERAVAAVDTMLGSLRIHDTAGATNAR